MKTYQIKQPKSKADYKGAPDTSPDLPCPVGIDLHPDIFDAVELRQGKKAKDATVTSRHCEVPAGEIATWATTHLDPQQHLLVIEATTNTFDVVGQLADAGFSSVVVDTTQIDKVSDAFIDNDQIAAERIARCYLTGMAKTVWVPDDRTIERRQLLQVYTGSVADRVRANNELKSFLTSQSIRPGQRNLELEKNQKWLRQQLADKLSPLQKEILDGHIANLHHAAGVRQKYYRMIVEQMLENQDMLKCLRVVGIGMINAFAIVAIVGDVKRFANAKKLVSYLGLNPGRKTSGKGKDKKKGTGNRGRGDMRSLLIQAAQSVLNQASRAKNKNKLTRWGFRLFARKGNRNIAVVAIARKLATALYYILSGRESDLAEQEAPLRRKFYNLSGDIGKAGRVQLGLPEKTKDCVDHLFEKVNWTSAPASSQN